MTAKRCLAFLLVTSFGWQVAYPLVFVSAQSVSSTVIEGVYSSSTIGTETVETASSSTSSAELLERQVREKEARIKELTERMKGYREQISAQEVAAVTLQNQIILLENRIQEKQLAIERVKIEMEAVSLRITDLTERLLEDEEVLERREKVLAELVQRVHEADQVTVLETFLVRPQLSNFFLQLESVKQLETDLTEAIRNLRLVKQGVEKERQDLAQHRLTVSVQREQLRNDQRALEQERAAKTALLAETQAREEEFQRLIYELRQQQQDEAEGIAELEVQLKDQLEALEGNFVRGDILLHWPVPVKRISARFHDPTYPFRNMFEHPGVDIPVSVGTPVKAAAGGYVVWTRRGKQYGNYVMLIHANGVATVYAHLSEFAVTPDTYVERGEVIGYSGGQPGHPGAGLSTGPHVHFEVRQNGIPVNPEQFLPDWEEAEADEE